MGALARGRLIPGNGSRRENVDAAVLELAELHARAILGQEHALKNVQPIVVVLEVAMVRMHRCRCGRVHRALCACFPLFSFVQASCAPVMAEETAPLGTNRSSETFRGGDNSEDVGKRRAKGWVDEAGTDQPSQDHEEED